MDCRVLPHVAHDCGLEPFVITLEVWHGLSSSYERGQL